MKTGMSLAVKDLHEGFRRTQWANLSLAPTRPERDVRDGAGGAARDVFERAIPIVADPGGTVSIVDGQPFTARHLADMEKTMHDKLEDLREEVAGQKASQSSSKRSKSRRRSRSPLMRRSRRLPTRPPRHPAVARRRRRGSRSS